MSIFHLLTTAYKTKQDLLTIAFLVGILFLVGGMLLSFLGLFLAAFGVLPMLLDRWLLDLTIFCFYGFFATMSVSCFFLFILRLPFVAVKRRQQIKKISSLKWHLRKPNDMLDVDKIDHLLVIGITLWSFQDLNGMELFQRHFDDKECSVQVFFMDDISALKNIQAFSPGTEAAWPTPAITEYRAGAVVRSLHGQDALRWMKQA